MKQRLLLAPTLREAPSDAEVVSHQLLLRAGYIRQVAAGVYHYLPLGRRVLRKLEEIIRKEMDRIGAQELLMPAIQPTELWQASGRYEVYGPELIRLQDRHGREFALGPTHEEVVTTLIGQEISSYRKLPLTVYQIQTKYRDEKRPRFGLLRGREFLMKDAYSFDIDEEGLDAQYWSMHAAYHRIFTRAGLRYLAVEADAGAIGGEGDTHEFMALTDIGEDTIVTCSSCQYASNLERAYAGAEQHASQEEQALEPPLAEARAFVPPMEQVSTPQVKTMEELMQFFKQEAKQMIKTMIVVADGKPAAVLLRGDHEMNETKVKNALQANELELADEDTIIRVTGAPHGFAGPVGLQVPVLIDAHAAGLREAIVGANQVDAHLRHVVPGRDFALPQVGDYRNVAEGDPCPRCEGTLQFQKGIEVGHIFKLGKKYSEPLHAAFLNEQGREQTMTMGCYGIGISRLLATCAEQLNDANGLTWPSEIAPFQVHIIPVSIKDDAQRDACEQLYAKLTAQSVEVLLDDRDERIGVKLKDADLIGIPLRIVCGRDLAEGLVEVKKRTEADKRLLSIEDAMQEALEMKR